MKTSLSSLSALLIIFLIINCQITYGQLVVTPNLSATQLTDILVGNGIINHSNAIFSGADSSRGSFTTGVQQTNLGIQTGIIFSTGNVMDAPGPNSNMMTSSNNGTGSDPQLAALIPGYAIYDACYLQFDFVPNSSIIKLRYVFASEEYPSWVGSSFNDVFGIFLTGPNQWGGYSNFNIALIPDTNLPVSIDNINENSFSQYYINNHSLGQGTIEYNGFTTVLTAWANVIPYQQYTIKIAIGDAGDASFDSAIFLEENSFLTSVSDIEINEKLNVLLYPNPTTSILHINVEYKFIEVYDISGKFLQHYQTGQNIDLSLYEKNIYFLRIVTDSFVRTEKIVVE